MSSCRSRMSEGDDAEMGIKLALQAILLAPHFVFKVELDAGPRPAREVHALDGLRARHATRVFPLALDARRRAARYRRRRASCRTATVLAELRSSG